MPKYIEDVVRRTHYELNQDQSEAVQLYITGQLSAGAAANRLGFNRQRFVNLVFNMLPQWYAQGRFNIEGNTEISPILRGHATTPREGEENGNNS